MFRLRPGPVILCADDYAIAAGVSRGILDLARARKITALSCLATLPRWTEDAKRLAEVRDRVSIGLHINFTLGRPLGLMPRLAPHNELPDVARLIRRALLRDLDVVEIRDEVLRQLTAFVAAAGFKPDHIDGHQHVHAIPLVRKGVLDALSSYFPTDMKPLIRDPGDRAFSISARGGEMFKAFTIAGLAYGFGYLARRRGFPVNRGFSGFSAFDTERSYDFELASAMRMTGAGHIVMCHPGYPDEELDGLDPVVERRGQELASISANAELEQRIWKPVRNSTTGCIEWSSLVGA